MNKKQVKKLEKKHNFRANPVLDQYFLINENTTQRIVRYGKIKPEETVLEIGPGLGFLTKQIAEKAGQVVTIEKDKDLEKTLKEQLEQYSNVKYIWDDCLEVEFPDFDKVISSLPYSISAPFTFKLLKHDFQKAVLIYQKEFGEKMVAEPGDSNYGRLSVMVQTYSKPKLREVIPRRNFYPKPDVDSALIELKPKSKQKDAKYDEFIREIFRYRNKNLDNAVEHGFGIEIEDDRKVKDLGLEELQNVYQSLKDKM